MRISATASPTSKVHGEGKRSTEVTATQERRFCTDALQLEAAMKAEPDEPRDAGVLS